MVEESKPTEPSTFSLNELQDGLVAHQIYQVRNFRFYLAIASICLVCLISTIDLVILASALPVVSNSMGASSSQAYWCGTGLLLAQAVAQPIYCALQSIIGNKELMLAALLVFGVASILCATAQNIEWLLAARVLQGIGIGGCNAMVNVLITDLTPIKVRGIFLGITQLTAAVGLVAGIVMGAAFSTVSTWRLIFWINIPICAISSAGIFFCIQSHRTDRTTVTVAKEFRQLDVAGVILLTGSMLGLLYGVTAGGVLQPWTSGKILAPILIGIFGIIAFTFYELRIAKKPMIQIHLLTNRTMASGFFTAWAHGAIDIALAYYLILYFLIGKLHPLLRSSLEITPGLATIPVWAAITGFAMAHTSHFKYFNIMSWIFLSTGVGSLASLTPSSPIGSAYGFQLILAVGSGALYPGRILAVQAPLQFRTNTQSKTNMGDDVSVTTTLVSVFTSIGNAFGVGLGGTIVQNQWDKLLSSVPEMYRIPSSSLEKSLEIIASNQWPDNIRAYYQGVLCDSLKVLWIFTATLSGIGFIATLFQEDIRLEGNREEA